MVELRGLEPLTLTLPARQNRVRSSPLSYGIPVPQRFSTLTNGGEQPWIDTNAAINAPSLGANVEVETVRAIPHRQQA